MRFFSKKWLKKRMDIAPKHLHDIKKTPPALNNLTLAQCLHVSSERRAQLPTAG
jgi:hypothetical protein